MRRSTTTPWLARFAALTALATIALIGIGGLVTSHGAGMAVPDWPTTYGYNMFAFPISKWVGGIFYEHSHRLVASGVGMLTTILAVWLWLKEERRWLRWLGVIAFFAVTLQGVLGGLRVTLIKQELGIFHATLAQLFLLLLWSIAFFLSPLWPKLLKQGGKINFHPWLRPMLIGTTVLILLQLIFGATMRHQHAGLAVPDFPLAYGKLWPPTNPHFIDQVNRARIDTRDFEPITAWQIYLHMAHRITALAIVIAVIGCTVLARKGERNRLIFNGINLWLALILLQAGLGAFTVLTNKAADVATLHVLCGAFSLVWGGLLSIAAASLAYREKFVQECTVPANARTNAPAYSR
ncbi:MAG: COX15/CtaA family protein [Verrucomicrobiota bacterium]